MPTIQSRSVEMVSFFTSIFSFRLEWSCYSGLALVVVLVVDVDRPAVRIFFAFQRRQNKMHFRYSLAHLVDFSSSTLATQLNSFHCFGSLMCTNLAANYCNRCCRAFLLVAEAESNHLLMLLNLLLLENVIIKWNSMQI